jgi:hypothetical protein
VFYETQHGNIDKVAVVSEGKNFNNNDQNLYYVTKKAIKSAGLELTVNYPYSFTKNTFWRRLLKSTKEYTRVVDNNIRLMFRFLKDMGVDVPYAATTSPIIFLDSLKNQLIGNLHMPHNDFIENGIYSMTFLPYSSKNAKVIKKYIQMLEMLVLTLDNIDTHEHSGTMQYFYADTENHVTIKTLPYPILTFVVSVVLPYLFKYPFFRDKYGKFYAMSLLNII